MPGATAARIAGRHVYSAVGCSHGEGPGGCFERGAGGGEGAAGGIDGPAGAGAGTRRRAPAAAGGVVRREGEAERSPFRPGGHEGPREEEAVEHRGRLPKWARLGFPR